MLPAPPRPRQHGRERCSGCGRPSCGGARAWSRIKPAALAADEELAYIGATRFAMALDSSIRNKVAEPHGSGKARASASIDLYEMASLYPRETGLPVTIWVSPRGKARHAARIKVCRVPGDRMVPSNTVSVRIQPEPKLVEGELPAAWFEPVARWITLNREALLEYWSGAIGTTELASRLKKLQETR
jgi:hypothetical protein